MNDYGQIEHICHNALYEISFQWVWVCVARPTGIVSPLASSKCSDM